jgi:hypothetical protein
MKKSIVFLVMIVSVKLMQAQDRAFISGGVSLFIGGDKVGDNLTVLPAITIMPGIKFVEAKEFGFLVAAPLEE